MTIFWPSPYHRKFEILQIRHKIFGTNSLATNDFLKTKLKINKIAIFVVGRTHISVNSLVYIIPLHSFSPLPHTTLLHSTPLPFPTTLPLPTSYHSTPESALISRNLRTPSLKKHQNQIWFPLTLTLKKHQIQPWFPITPSLKKHQNQIWFPPNSNPKKTSESALISSNTNLEKHQNQIWFPLTLTLKKHQNQPWFPVT